MQQENALQSADTLKKEKASMEAELQSQVLELEAKNANLRKELQQAQDQLDRVTIKNQSTESLHKKESGM